MFQYPVFTAFYSRKGFQYSQPSCFFITVTVFTFSTQYSQLLLFLFSSRKGVPVPSINSFSHHVRGFQYPVFTAFYSRKRFQYPVFTAFYSRKVFQYPVFTVFFFFPSRKGKGVLVPSVHSFFFPSHKGFHYPIFTSSFFLLRVSNTQYSQLFIHVRDSSTQY